jgi:cobalt-zinc-cadmium resistance protein CzcA
LLNVPFAAVGGIVALLITQFNFSISAGIGFIALFGICIQNGVIMIPWR